MPMQRRRFLQLAGTGTFFLSAGVKGALPGSNAPTLRFPQGVASGDPQADAVMLWTRAEPVESLSRAPLTLQISPSPDFNELLVTTTLHADVENDYTVRAYVDGLEPATRYYYRFLGGANSQSTVGRTCTAPSPDSDANARLALTSCQNYENGLFGGWARMIAEDEAASESEQIDFVLHVGDFIYERAWPTRYRGGPQARLLPAFPDGQVDGKNSYAVSLADYRHLYKTYLADPHLQAARARWPFICTWDDHEFSNDNFQAYSYYHDSAKLEARRKQSANRAWFEYIPAVLTEDENSPAHDYSEDKLPESDEQANTTAINSLCIYRTLRWGKDIDLIVTDSRSYRSAPCVPPGMAKQLGLPLPTRHLVDILDGGRDFDGGNPPATLPYGDAPNPARDQTPGTLLGSTQREWFLNELSRSSARWKLWGNALPILPLRLDLSRIPFAELEDSIFNFDAWGGYPGELQALLSAVEAAGVTGLVSLSGDHHMHAAGTVKSRQDDPSATMVAAEFNTAGISSDSLFDAVADAADKGDNAQFRDLVYRVEDGQPVPTWNMTLQDGCLAATVYARTGMRDIARWLGPNEANTGLRYIDSQARGYAIVAIESDAISAELTTLQDVANASDELPPVQHRARFSLKAWSAGQTPQLSGPQFDGSAPFPYREDSV